MQDVFPHPSFQLFSLSTSLLCIHAYVINPCLYQSCSCTLFSFSWQRSTDWNCLHCCCFCAVSEFYKEHYYISIIIVAILENVFKKRDLECCNTIPYSLGWVQLTDRRWGWWRKGAWCSLQWVEPGRGKRATGTPIGQGPVCDVSMCDKCACVMWVNMHMCIGGNEVKEHVN